MDTERRLFFLAASSRTRMTVGGERDPCEFVRGPTVEIDGCIHHRPGFFRILHDAFAPWRIRVDEPVEGAAHSRRPTFG